MFWSKKMVLLDRDHRLRRDRQHGRSTYPLWSKVSFWPKIRRAYLIGDAAQAFSAHLGESVPHQISATLERAVAEATRDALASGDAEPVVLLSPACASYDQFPSFTARGDAFKAMVASLPGIVLREPEAP